LRLSLPKSCVRLAVGRPGLNYLVELERLKVGIHSLDLLGV